MTKKAKARWKRLAEAAGAAFRWGSLPKGAGKNCCKRLRGRVACLQLPARRALRHLALAVAKRKRVPLQGMLLAGAGQAKLRGYLCC